MSMSPAQKEAQARALGYPSWEAMMLYHQARQRQSGGTVAIKGATPPPQQGAPVSPKAQDMMSWHPLSVFRRITEALKGANSQ